MKYERNLIDLWNEKFPVLNKYQTDGVGNLYCYLFFNPDNKLFKIGVTVGAPESRAKGISDGCGSNIMVVAFVKTIKKKSPYHRLLEKSLHTFYSSRKVRGEWFKLSLYDIDQICCLFDKLGVMSEHLYVLDTHTVFNVMNTDEINFNIQSWLSNEKQVQYVSSYSLGGL